jgi:hypothetical protein
MATSKTFNEVYVQFKNSNNFIIGEISSNKGNSRVNSPFCWDISQTKLCFVEGYVGSGKSVAIYSIVHQFAEQFGASNVYITDPRRVDWNGYERSFNILRLKDEFSNDVKLDDTLIENLEKLCGVQTPTLIVLDCLDKLVSNLKVNKIERITNTIIKLLNNPNIFMCIGLYLPLNENDHLTMQITEAILNRVKQFTKYYKISLSKKGIGLATASFNNIEYPIELYYIGEEFSAKYRVMP